MAFLSVPAFEMMPDVREEIDRIYREYAFIPRGTTEESFEITVDRACSGMLADDATPRDKMRYDILKNHNNVWFHFNLDWSTFPSKMPLSDKELVEAYLKDTPLLEDFLKPVELPWRYKDRLEHTHIIGRTGSGKTVLMERMIHEDLLDPAKPALVVITPHGDLIRSLRNLASPLSDRMIVVDPTDEKYPPAINPFSTKRKISPNGVIKTFDYVLASLGLELTPKQTALWKPVIRMLIQLPNSPMARNATIADISDFMLNPEKYRKVVESLEDPSFFLDNIYVEKPAKSKFDETRSEIGYRLSAVLSDPSIRRIFSSPETKVDFYDELQNRKAVVLINTAKYDLSDGSSLFGGMMLALIFQAIFARDAIADEDRRQPTFVYVDEAANYFAEDISDMLTELRKFRCGLILSHHELAQAQKRSAQLADALVSQPGVRFANPSAKDAPRLADEMHTAEESLRHLPDYHFATYIRGITPKPFPTKITPLTLPQMTRAAQEVFKWKNRDRTSFGPPQGATKSSPEEKPDEGWV